MAKIKYQLAQKEVLRLYQQNNPERIRLKNQTKTTPTIPINNSYRSFFIKELGKSIVLTFFIILIQFIIYLAVNGKL